MRPRLTLAFGLLTLLVVVVFVSLRSLTISDLAEQNLRSQVFREAMVLASVLAEDSSTLTTPPSVAALTPYSAPDRRVTVTMPDGQSAQATGAEWEDAAAADAVIGRLSINGVTVEVDAPQQQVDRDVAAAIPSLLALGTMLVLLAIVLGAVVAGRLARPFVQLAAAANALARGRYDLHLPDTRIKEARAIGVALEGGAMQLEQSLRREQDLALRASHELRTPLTALRLELYDLVDCDDVSPELVAAADRATGHIDRLDQAVGALLEETRTHPVVATAQVGLGPVVAALARRWSSTLDLAGVAFEAELLGDTAIDVTPGPLEQILDGILLESLAHRGSQVRLVVEGGGHIRITVIVEAASVAARIGGPSSPLERARAVVETVGGRMSGGLTMPSGLIVIVPKR
ncbi:MAG: HAMP domain-containing protein [Nocardioides sp.]